MVAITETHQQSRKAPDVDQARILRAKLIEVSEVNRSGRVFLGSALIMSAIGLWLVPVTEGDAAMKLIKLLLSTVLLLLGAMFIFSISRSKDLPEIQIDTVVRELRIVKRDEAGTQYIHARHPLESLSEVNLINQMFIARDADGRLVASVPLSNRKAEAALRSALEKFI